MIKDTIFMFSSTISRIFTTIIIFLFLARELGTDLFGTFMYFYTLTSLLTIIVDYGFALKLVKEISKRPEQLKKIFIDSLMGKIFLCIILLIISLCIILFNDFNSTELSIYILLLITALLYSFGQFFCLPFRSIGLFNIEARINIISNIITFIILFIISFTTKDLIILAIGFLVCRLIFVFICLFYLNKFSFFENIKQFVSVKSSILILLENFPYALQLTIGSLYLQVDTFIIHNYLGDSGVGLHQATFRIVMGGIVLIEILNNVYLPRLSKISGDDKKLIALGENFTRDMLFIGGISSLSLAGFSFFIVNLAYSDEYMNVILLLKLFSFTLMLRFLSAPLGSILTIINKQYIKSYISVVTLIINILLNFVLIKHFSLEGAIYAGFLTELFLLSTYIIFVKISLKTFIIKGKGILITIVTFSGLILLFILGNEHFLQFLIYFICILMISLLYFNRRKIENIIKVINPLKYNKNDIKVR